MAVCQNLVPLVNIKIAGKWMFIPLKIAFIGIDPWPYFKHYRCISWDFSHRFTSFKSSKPQMRCSLPLASGARSLSAFLAAGGLFVLLSMLSPSTKQGSEAEAQMEPTGDGYLQHPRKFSELKTMIFWAIEIELGCIPTEIWLRIQLLNGLHIHLLRIIFWGSWQSNTDTMGNHTIIHFLPWLEVEMSCLAPSEPGFQHKGRIWWRCESPPDQTYDVWGCQKSGIARHSAKYPCPKQYFSDNLTPPIDPQEKNERDIKNEYPNISQATLHPEHSLCGNFSGRWNGPLSCSKICWHSMVWCPGDANLTMFDFNISTNGDGSKPWYLVNPKIAGKWMLIPLKMYL